MFCTALPYTTLHYIIMYLGGLYHSVVNHVKLHQDKHEHELLTDNPRKYDQGHTFGAEHTALQ